MVLANKMKCADCGLEMGAATWTAHRDLLQVLEFTCRACVEKIAKCEAVTLDSETSWGAVIAKLKGQSVWLNP
jgi:hypothetical protein